MRRIDHPLAVGIRPAVQPDGTQGHYTEGNPGTGQEATPVSADWLNDVQDELVTVIEAAGLPATKGTAQLLQALYLLLTPTGTIQATIKNTAAAGWVLLNDGTIGNAASGATTRANADCQALYLVIWTNISNTYAPVTGGRGSTALQDFNAGKPIALPRVRGRVLAGAGTGSGLTPRSLGEFLGEEEHTLTVAELASHTHTENAVVAGSNFAAGGNAHTNTPVASGSAGSDDPHNTMQPTTFVNFVIKL